jgi:uncharacterized protein with HEPN domain
MKPKDRRYGFYLEDMLVSMERIQEYLGELEFIQFKQKYIVVDAVIRNFEIIGEASKHIPEDIISKYPDIPWKKMYDLRNIVTHEYFGIDYEMLWEIDKNDLPKNQIDLQRLIEIEKKSTGTNKQYSA